ncbi:fungal-specific transcription factor domain-containing protein [Pyrenochaeta sp. MPI-SDFR-AT-0127]|nr:fungal-specific transcription factor domain-containing protein [Pyrenochaeta sp. MPI-SDFR-AT-0127]
MDRAGDPKQRFSKSRNGMSVFTKPACEQCARRRITCGGYKIDVRWKQSSEPKRQSPPRRPRGNSSSQGRPLAKFLQPSTSRQVATDHGPNEGASNASPPQLHHRSTSEDMMDLVFLDSDMGSASMSLPTPQTLEFLMQGFDQNQSLPPLDQLSHCSTTSPPQSGDVYTGSGPQSSNAKFSSELWNMETFWEDYLRPTAHATLDTGPPSNDQQLSSETLKFRADEAERIAFLFHQQTCCTLSIQEDSNQNPWRTLIWPLAKEHPALWHAIAALTCFCMSKQQPQLRADGARHVRRSAQLLSENMEKGEIPPDAALAATLSLGFAETWDYENSSTGISHIRGAGELLSQILSDHPSLILKSEEEARVEFLYNTWTYMDVLARFTCSEIFPTYSASTPIPNWSELGWNTSQLDPLMGYSTTFFPVMRRVADLINKVRARPTPRNSPAIISQGLELKRIIEDWTPPVDLEAVDDPSPNMTDAIQTAEAYRWSTLCLLYQAVPELPNLTSYGELAQKILIYLATIPLNSTTIIVHILPLMVAGCDAVEDEDREFVRERWGAMSKRMVTGVTSRCLKITEEVWKRREEYLWARGLSVSPNGLQVNSAASESAALSNDIANFITFGTSPGAATTSSGGSPAQANPRSLHRANGFPISAAFKKGVDTLTRSGCSEYTVRGRLHWLGVMKDWNWQVMLG